MKQTETGRKEVKMVCTTAHGDQRPQLEMQVTDRHENIFYGTFSVSAIPCTQDEKCAYCPRGARTRPKVILVDLSTFREQLPPAEIHNYCIGDSIQRFLDHPLCGHNSCNEEWLGLLQSGRSYGI